jgi:DNA processing protein
MCAKILSERERIEQIAFSLAVKKTAVGKRLLEHYKTPGVIFREKHLGLTGIKGLTSETIDHLRSKSLLSEAMRVLERCNALGIGLYFYSDIEYPYRLRHCQDPPMLLYTLGSVSMNASRYLAIVGTRKCTFYAEECIQQLLSQIAVYKPIIVSGLALGVDGIAHRHTIQNSLQGLAIMGHGLDICYPAEHRSLSERLCQNGGLISEHPPGTPADPIHFPRRNRIIAGMSDAVVVIESRNVGGSIITANIANSYNREVFAVPGRISDASSEGCNQLIQKNKAAIYLSPGSLAENLGWTEKHNQQALEPTLFESLDGDEKTIAEIIYKFGSITLDALCAEVSLPVERISVLLLTMELQGVVKSMPGKRYSVLN